MFGFVKKILGSNDTLVQEYYDRGAIILDVRTPKEYNSGHVEGSVNIPLQNLGEKVLKLRQGNRPVITCCASGMRSAAAARQLKSAGMEAINGGSWTSLQKLKR